MIIGLKNSSAKMVYFLGHFFYVFNHLLIPEMHPTWVCGIILVVHF